LVNSFFLSPVRILQDIDLIAGAAQLLQELSAPLSSTTTDKQQYCSTTEIPVGQWRDSIFALFHYGYCHGSVWTATCCLPIATGQVISRLHLTMWGQAGAPIRSRSIIFAYILCAVFTFVVIRIFFFLLIALVDPNVMNESMEWVEPSATYYALCATDDLFGLLGAMMVVWYLSRVRSHVRARYGIPGNSIGDLACSTFCPVLVGAQLLRHTTDYEKQPSLYCCSETGIPLTAPSIV
jgi:Cys-rich protein (TIGR01571 family)